MKKFLAMFAIAVALVACNDSGSGTDSSDTANKAGDTTNQTAPPVTPTPDTSGTGTGTGTDTTGKTGDTTGKK